MIRNDNQDDFINQALEKYANMVRRICFMYLHNDADVDDVFQEVFIKLVLKGTTFESDEHEKAWLIRVAINECKDLLRNFWRKRIVVTDYIEQPFKEPIESDLIEVVLTLPPKLKEVIYLFYYEGYSVPQMAVILNKKENTIYSHLHRAKLILKDKLEGKENDYIF